MIATLCDTGAILAAIDPGQGEIHFRCLSQLKAIQGRLVTTWPCVAEGMRIADTLRGRPLQHALWNQLKDPTFELAALDKIDGSRMDLLMERYSNLPMDLADASLFVVAEKLRSRRVFTLDNHRHPWAA